MTRLMISPKAFAALLRHTGDMSLRCLPPPRPIPKLAKLSKKNNNKKAGSACTARFLVAFFPTHKSFSGPCSFNFSSIFARYPRTRAVF